MAEVRDVMAYLCAKYPFKDELSKARLNKMIYLADWRMSLTSKRQVTPLTWTFNHYGPYLDEIRAIAERDSDRFVITQEVNMYGSRKEVIGLTGKDTSWASLQGDEIAALDHVIEETKPMTWAAFIKLVYSTYPIATQPRHQDLDLVGLATKYQRELAAVG